MNKVLGIGSIILGLCLVVEFVALVVVFPLNAPAWAGLLVSASVFGSIFSIFTGVAILDSERTVSLPLTRASRLRRRMNRLREYELELRNLSLPNTPAQVVTEAYIEETERQKELLAGEIHEHEMKRLSRKIGG